MLRQFRSPQGMLCCALITVACLSGAACAAPEDSSEKGVEFFEKRIRPIFVERCIHCHGEDLASGKLRLDSKAAWQRGGESGPAIVPGDPAASLLIRAVSHDNGNLKMPPPDDDDPLSDRQIQDLVYWVRQGAIDPRAGSDVASDIEAAARNHWAFQPVRSPTIESVDNPIDVLIDRRLDDQGFLATEPADNRTLIRRAVFDLTGLPPTASHLATSRERFPMLVKELLASPRYGERWGRHWLDVARYSDAKDGVLMYGDARIRPFAYTYRDYVIRAFNDDKPFDQFIREQLAADQLPLPQDSPNLAAMGLLTLGRMFDGNRHDVVDDQIDVVTRGLQGLTVSCARCHDHKFDPIPTADYYSLYGVFASCQEPLERPRIEDPSAAGDSFESEYDTKLQEVYSAREKHYDDTLRAARERTPDYLVQVATTEPDISETTIFFLSLIPDQLRPQITWRWRQLIARRAFPDDPVFGAWHDMMREPTLHPAEWQQRGIDERIIDGLMQAGPETPEQVARTHGEIFRAAWKQAEEQTTAADDDPLATLLVSRSGPVWFPIEDTARYLERQMADAFRGLVGQLDAIAVKHHEAAARAMVLVDSDVLCEPVIFQRGDAAARGNPVPRQFLNVVAGTERQPFPNGSGRLNLANAIVSPENPLTARVWVNRVWMHHFGAPLVENPDDFGLRTPQPVYHELLDYLAAYLVDNGWQTKPLHELIMSSRAYQRASLISVDERMRRQLEVDPDNQFVWHANRRRLDLEQMRDTVLAVSGQLDETMYGRPPLITDEHNTRRTVYAFVERQNIPSMVQTFDFANADTSTARRVITTVPQQALFAMNSPFMARSAEALAARLGDGATAARIRHAYTLTLGRLPSDEELHLAESFVSSASLQQFAQVLLMSNELMFVD